MGLSEAMATFVAEDCRDGRCPCDHPRCTHACHSGGPIYQLFPDLSPGDYEALKADIAKRGLLVPVELDEEGNVLDGHHRVRACDELGITDYPRIVRDGMTPREKRSHIRSLNMIRRQLSQEERRQVVAAELRDRPQQSNRTVARRLGVDHKTVKRERDELEESGELPHFPEREDPRTGKLSQPAKKVPATEVRPGDRITDDEGDQRRVASIEDAGDELVIHDGQGDAVIVSKEKELEVEQGRAPKKADLGGGVTHPARFSDDLIDVFAEILADTESVLDPFAGTGRIHELMERGVRYTTGVEIEPEWAELHERTKAGSALDMDFDDGEFDAICTSPTYGNRLADHHNAVDPETRRSYAHDLGHPLAEQNSGAMQWGAEYRAFHYLAWQEAIRVLRPGGRFVLNIKDHIRAGERQYVAGWHVNTLVRHGLNLLFHVDVEARGMRAGTNADLREPHELVYVFEKPDSRA